MRAGTCYNSNMEDKNLENREEHKEESSPASGAERFNRRLIGNVMMVISIVLFITGIYFVLREYVIPPDTNYVAPPSPALVVEPVATPSPIITEAPLSTPAPTPMPTPYNLLPVEISFPTFEQVCEVQPVGKVNPKTKEEVEPNEPGAMGTVDSNIIAAWYKYGPAPGDRGNAIINGHKSWKGERGVFYELKEMQKGDQVIVKMNDDSYLYWYVDTVDVYPRDAVPISVMEPRWGEEPMLTLISCTGTWDALAGTSSKRSVVTLKLEENSAE